MMFPPYFLPVKLAKTARQAGRKSHLSNVDKHLPRGCRGR
jgi:hypothetical protein